MVVQELPGVPGDARSRRASARYRLLRDRLSGRIRPRCLVELRQCFPGPGRARLPGRDPPADRAGPGTAPARDRLRRAGPAIIPRRSIGRSPALKGRCISAAYCDHEMIRGRFLSGLAGGVVLVPSLLTAAAAAPLAGDRARASFSRGAIAPGRAMPAMTAPMADGREFTLASLRGHPLWINCFATWCEPCNQEMPTIVSIARRYAGRGLRVLGISMSENAAVLPAFIKEYAIPFPVV
ncbi:TlpA family protein disulfide reductase, partial [bacterium]